MNNGEYYSIDLGAKLEHNDEFLRALGDVTYTSAWLEGILSGLVADMNGGNSANVLMAEMSFNGALNAARAVAHAILEDGMYKRYFYACCAKAQQAYDARNKIVHSMWFAVEGTSSDYVALRYRVKGKWVRHEHVVSLSELHNIANNIANVGVRFSLLGNSPAFRSRPIFKICDSCGHHL